MKLSARYDEAKKLLSSVELTTTGLPKAAPCPRVKELGLVTVKSGGGVTVAAMVVLWVGEPLLPVTVNV